MKKLFSLILTIVAVAVFSGATYAQGTVAPNTELYMGYQAVHSDARNFRLQDVAHGANVSATWFVSDDTETTPVGFVLEGAGNFKNDESLLTAMGGLVLKARSNKTFQPFVRGLAGVGRSSTGVADTGFSFALGGGLDVRAGAKISVRVFQGDYLQTRLFGDIQHSVRFGAGVVF
jgi:hypothetical protein